MLYILVVYDHYMPEDGTSAHALSGPNSKISAALTTGSSKRKCLETNRKMNSKKEFDVKSQNGQLKTDLYMYQS